MCKVRKRGKKRKQREKKQKNRMHNKEKEPIESRTRQFRLSVLCYRKWEKKREREREREGEEESKKNRIKKDRMKKRRNDWERSVESKKRWKSHALRMCLLALCSAWNPTASSEYSRWIQRRIEIHVNISWNKNGS